VRLASVPTGLAQGARIMLLTADGVSDTWIAMRVGVSRRSAGGTGIGGGGIGGSMSRVLQPWHHRDSHRKGWQSRWVEADGLARGRRLFLPQHESECSNPRGA
jgi:hypothetical protein